MPTQQQLSARVRFGPHEVLPVERQLRVDGVAAAIGSRAFDVLVTLIERAGRTVTRGELLEAAWPGLVVEENNLSVQIAALRRVLGPQVITTIPGLGYRFSAALDGAAQDAPAAAAPAASPRRAPGNVAPFPPDLIGRDAELADLEALLQRHRLVTVSGAGGIGKTRVALAVAARLAPGCGAGAWVVELAPIVDAAQVPAAVAQALGLRLPGVQPPLDELAEALADEPMLVVLDNCEHLVDETSRLAQALLARTRRLRLLATSQELLKLSDEHAYRLPPLSVPASVDDTMATHGAIRLLVERVRALDPAFALTSSNAADALEVCRRLDGLPLAIELAAARVPLLGLAGVRARLDDRLQMLTSGARGGLHRHRTLRAMLAWSHSLLGPAEAAAFRRAGVFAGSFAIEQAQSVLAGPDDDPWEALDMLGSLVDKSLVVVERSEPPRYRLLESARAYALEMLRDAGELEAVRRRHAQAYARSFGASLALEWRLASQLRRERFLPDLDNGRSALDWAAHADAGLYIALAGAIAWLFAAAGHPREGLSHCRRALAQAGAATPPRERARLLQEISVHDHGSSGLRKLAAAKQAVRLLRPLGDRAALYSALGRLAISAALSNSGRRGDAATAEMASLLDPAWPALARWDLLNARDYLANHHRRADEAEALAADELTLARVHGDVGKTLFAMLAMEQCVAARGRYGEAVERGRELIALAQRENQVEHLHIYIFNLATALAMDGQLDEALVHARRSAELDARHDSLWKGLDLMALIALRRGRLDDAARIVGRSDAVNAHRDGDREPVEANVYAMVVDTLAARLPAQRREQLRAQGAMLTDAQASALALDEDALT